MGIVYTRLLRKVVSKLQEMAGHCDGGGSTGHCS